MGMFVVAVLSVALALTIGVAAGLVEVPEQYAPWVWFALGVLALAVAVGELLLHRRRAKPAPIDLDRVADQLASAVRQQWQAEEDRRQINDPAPMPVYWQPAPVGLVDHDANAMLTPVGKGARPLELPGRIEDIATIYASVASKRLIILGRAGAGKTVLAARLVLDLLKSRKPGAPVPVLLSIGSWNPATTAFRDWLVEQLGRDYPALASTKRRKGLAAALVTEDRIVPILDGFDEVAAGLHRQALERLNTVAQMPLVVTSRPEEYTAAVTSAGY